LMSDSLLVGRLEFFVPGRRQLEFFAYQASRSGGH
jgi:hypothetical protein